MEVIAVKKTTKFLDHSWAVSLSNPSGAMITQLIPIPSARLGQRWKGALKGNKLRTTFNSSCQIIRISTKQHHVTVLPKKNTDLCFSMHLINACPNRHRVIFLWVRPEKSHQFGAYDTSPPEKPQRISIHSTDNIGKGLSKDLALEVEENAGM